MKKRIRRAITIITVACIGLSCICVITYFCLDLKTADIETEDITVDSEVEEAIHKAIPDFNADESCVIDFASEAHTILGAEEKDNTIEVYLMALYMGYLKNEDGKLQEKTGSHMPIVITFEKNQNGYVVKEYWEPEDGTEYVDSIKGKFPSHLWEKALDTQAYIQRHEETVNKEVRKWESEKR